MTTASEAPRTDTAFGGTFFDPRGSVDMEGFVVSESTSGLDAGSVTRNVSRKLVGYQNSLQGWYSRILDGDR
jgi:hypothetical protein